VTTADLFPYVGGLVAFVVMLTGLLATVRRHG
jgi:hypothetical protein